MLQNVLAGPLYVLHQSREVAEPIAKQLLERVGLAEKLGAMPDQLSGGQQQRVAIARALAMQPEAILFDEPTSALDPRMAAEVIGVITDLAKSGQTMIVVTHAMGFARDVSNTVHVMHAGRIAESGPPDQIFGSPREEITRQFLVQTKVELSDVDNLIGRLPLELLDLLRLALLNSAPSALRVWRVGLPRELSAWRVFLHGLA